MKGHIPVKYCALVFCFIFILNNSPKAAVNDNLELGVNINLFLTQASTPKYFFKEYRESALELDFDIKYDFRDNLSFVLLPFVQTQYDINSKKRTDTFVRIWQGYLRYEISDFEIELGRFAFEDEAISSFIYYGGKQNKDLALPTALDGIRHSYNGKYIDYTFLTGRESEIIEEKKAVLIGGTVKVKPLSWLNIKGLYFYSAKEYESENKAIDNEAQIYGGGIDIKMNEESGIKIYYGRKEEREEISRNNVSTFQENGNNIATGEIYFKSENKVWDIKNKLGINIISGAKEKKTIPSKREEGIIYGGMNYNNMFPGSPKNIYAVMELNYNKYKFIYNEIGVYIYASEKEKVTNQTYYAQEMNISMGVKFEEWGIRVTGGIFEGEAIFLGVANKEQQNIKKLEAKFYYTFKL